MIMHLIVLHFKFPHLYKLSYSTTQSSSPSCNAYLNWNAPEMVSFLFDLPVCNLSNSISLFFFFLFFRECAPAIVVSKYSSFELNKWIYGRVALLTLIKWALCAFADTVFVYKRRKMNHERWTNENTIFSYNNFILVFLLFLLDSLFLFRIKKKRKRKK